MPRWCDPTRHFPIAVLCCAEVFLERFHFDRQGVSRRGVEGEDLFAGNR
ncbi:MULTISPECIES: hypothetical protein [Eubacteriales]|nr:MULTISPECIES: hypothetical protein [Eubacteriales]